MQITQTPRVLRNPGDSLGFPSQTNFQIWTYVSLGLHCIAKYGHSGDWVDTWPVMSFAYSALDCFGTSGCPRSQHMTNLIKSDWGSDRMVLYQLVQFPATFNIMMTSVNNNTKNDDYSNGEYHEKMKKNYAFGVRKMSRAQQMVAVSAIRKSQAAYKDVLQQDFRESLSSPVPAARVSLTAHLGNETTPCRLKHKFGALKRSYDSSCVGTAVVVMYLKFNFGAWKLGTCQSFYPRPVWPSGIIVACVCLSVRVSITCLSAW